MNANYGNFKYIPKNDSWWFLELPTNAWTMCCRHLLPTNSTRETRPSKGLMKPNLVSLTDSFMAKNFPSQGRI